MLLGHHIDDIYENFFIRLLRGSGLKGLISFYSIETKNNKSFKILRPLKQIKKKELAYLSSLVFNFFINIYSRLIFLSFYVLQGCEKVNIFIQSIFIFYFI